MRVVIGDQVMEILYGGRMIVAEVYLNLPFSSLDKLEAVQIRIRNAARGPVLHLCMGGMRLMDTAEGCPSSVQSTNAINTPEPAILVYERLRQDLIDLPTVIVLSVRTGMDAKLHWKGLLDTTRDVYDRTPPSGRKKI
jgi:hypothetical protein